MGGVGRKGDALSGPFRFVLWARRRVVGALVGYKRHLSPWLPRACRFTPTCSEYAALAVERYGIARGSLRAAHRLVRCQPFHPGGVDLP